MNTSSAIPATAQNVIKKFDDALRFLASNGFAHFIAHEKKQRTFQKTSDLGFVHEIQKEMHHYLQKNFGEIVTPDASVLGRRRVNLKIDFPDHPTYVELGMNYSDSGNQYRDDCNKLKDVISENSRAIGVLVHFHFYNHWDDRMHCLFRQQLPGAELSKGYWSDFDTIPSDGAAKHFVRLVFGARHMGEDFLPIKGYDHVEFYVGNARQAAHFYDKTFGFKPVAKAGLETGCRDRSCYLMEQGNARFIFSSAYGPDHEITRHCALHGDGVKAIGLSVQSVESALAETKKRGATVLQPATSVKDEHGTFVTGTIKYAGDVVFRFVDRTRYKGTFPFFKPIEAQGSTPVGIAAIDHIVTNVYLGEMNYWVWWFERVMGFTILLRLSDMDISTDYSALMS